MPLICDTNAADSPNIWAAKFYKGDKYIEKVLIMVHFSDKKRYNPKLADTMYLYEPDQAPKRARTMSPQRPVLMPEIGAGPQCICDKGATLVKTSTTLASYGRKYLNCPEQDSGNRLLRVDRRGGKRVHATRRVRTGYTVGPKYWCFAFRWRTTWSGFLQGGREDATLNTYTGYTFNRENTCSLQKGAI